jgi:aspartate-semialdehyde dehydrogenase
MDHDVPLVVPEINPQAAANHPRNIIANPNCTTIISLMALAPLHQAFGLKAIIASSYQAVSGSGAQGIAELEQQVHAIANGLPLEQKVYSRQIAFNVIPQVDSFTDNGYTKEELKMLNEGRKILDLPELKVSCTCVRVPVFIGHAEAVHVEFERPITEAQARAAWKKMPGLSVFDKREDGGYITPLDAVHEDDVYVSRLRRDPTVEHGLAFWCVADNLRKGAALNAVQIAEALVKMKMLDKQAA